MRVGILQDVKSWIWAPGEVQCYTSLDTVDFELFGSRVSNMDPEDYDPKTERIGFEGNRVARYLRLHLRQFNGGEIPEWHLGRYNPTWVFADEFEFDVEPLE